MDRSSNIVKIPPVPHGLNGSLAMNLPPSPSFHLDRGRLWSSVPGWSVRFVGDRSPSRDVFEQHCSSGDGCKCDRQKCTPRSSIAYCNHEESLCVRIFWWSRWQQRVLYHILSWFKAISGLPTRIEWNSEGLLMPLLTWDGCLVREPFTRRDTSSGVDRSRTQKRYTHHCSKNHQDCSLQPDHRHLSLHTAGYAHNTSRRINDAVEYPTPLELQLDGPPSSSRLWFNTRLHPESLTTSSCPPGRVHPLQQLLNLTVMNEIQDPSSSEIQSCFK